MTEHQKVVLLPKTTIADGMNAGGRDYAVIIVNYDEV